MQSYDSLHNEERGTRSNAFLNSTEQVYSLRFECLALCVKV